MPLSELMDGRITRIAPLVDELQRFCGGHELGDGRAAAAEMLACLRRPWPGVPEVSLRADRDDDRDAEELVLGVIREVGKVAEILLSAEDTENRLAWSRANLRSELERYLVIAQ